MTEEQQKSGADFSDLRETPMEAEPGFLKKERPGWTAGRTIADAVEILREKPECAQEQVLKKPTDELKFYCEGPDL